MKKLRKMILPIVCMMALPAFAGCEKEHAPTEPCEMIKITKPEKDIVVGDVIDLDDYVTAYYSSYDEALYSDYEVTVRETSADVVSLEGHKLTALKEGEINLDVIAGWPEENRFEARIAWSSLSQLKSDWKTAVQDITKTFGLKSDDLTDDGSMWKTVHTDNYTYLDGWWSELPAGSSVPAGKTEDDIDRDGSGATYVYYNHGGYIIFDSGVCYEWVADKDDGSDLTIFSAPIDNYDYYFVNMPWGLPWDKCTTTVKNTGKEVLVYKSDTVGQYADYFPNLATEFMYSTCQLYPDGGFTKMEIYKDLAGNFIINPYYKYFGKTYHDIELTLMKPADTKIAYLDQAIEDNIEPEPLAYNEIGEFADKLVTAGSYSYTATYGWVNSRGQTAACPQQLADYGWDVALSNGSANGYVNPTTQYCVDDKGQIDIYFEQEGKLYTASNLDKDGNVGDTIAADEATQFNSLEAAGLTAKAFGSAQTFWADFLASTRSESEGTISFTYAGGFGAGFNQAVMKSFICSYYLWNFCGNAYVDINGFSFVDGSVTVSESAMTIGFEFNYDSDHIYTMTIAISGLGEDAVPAFTPVMPTPGE
mgnify:CR=1 FL=1